MQNYLTHNANGISDSIGYAHIAAVPDPRFVFISKQRYLQLMRDVGDTLAMVKYAFIKGESLSLLAYGKLGVRISSDIDILIPRDSLRFIEKAIIAKGYNTDLPLSEQRNTRIFCLSSSHQLMPYRKICRNLNIEIDLNFDLFWGEHSDGTIDITEFLSDVIDIEIYGNLVKTLPPLKAMVQLVLHHYKEMNSIYHLAGHNSIKFDMFRDVFFLWENNREIMTQDEMLKISEKYGIVPYVYYVLSFTNKIFQDVELSKYVDAFRTPEGVDLLDYYGLSEKERKPWRFDFKTRLESENLYELIKDDLTQEDFEKLDRNRLIFG